MVSQHYMHTFLLFTFKNKVQELIVKTNFGYTCTEFYNFLKTEVGRNSIVKYVQKSDKYL